MPAAPIPAVRKKEIRDVAVRPGRAKIGCHDRPHLFAGRVKPAVDGGGRIGEVTKEQTEQKKLRNLGVGKQKAFVTRNPNGFEER